ncbi:MAG TPA: class I SAM-dependent methyltransferase [Kineosporiaceae bacterium]|nr:class I SAM-dependent methyltransferase [Kineosporiaceae bacterium]
MTELPTRPIEASWLALREPADARARDTAAQALLPPLLARLPTSDAAADPVPGLRIVDLGAGTGANLRWLAPRLPDPDRQHWMLVDHDPGLLARGPVQATPVRADVADLARVLPELGGADLITTAALLDLLDLRQLTAIVDAVVAAEVPALFSLSVTGEATLTPSDPQDQVLAESFDAHQRRDARPGPEAGAIVADLFHDRGWSVLTARTAWELRSDTEAALVSAWLEGRVEAAVEHRPDLAAQADGWLERRRGQLTAGVLTAVVGHVDVLALPS